jgi:hypothetical protein
VFLISNLLLLTHHSRVIAQDDPGKKKTPAASATIHPRDIARSEQQNPVPPERKKVENENLTNEPHQLPVPAGAIGQRFDIAAAQGAAMKIKPSKTATITVKEVERREKAAPEAANQRKKLENEELTNEPRELPVPPGAKGTPFRVETPPSPPPAAGTPEKSRKKNTSAIEPDFPAIGDNNMTIPPDLGGAVGPNHVMTALNSQIRMQDRTGTTLTTVSLNGFFSALIPGASNVFDPKVLYDPFAGRWTLTAPASSNSASSSLLIAVSATSDPTGVWTGYAFDVDAANTNWFDYPSVGFNKNWIVVTGNLYQVVAPGSPDPFQGEQVYIFDKAALYAGTATPVVTNRPTSEGFTFAPAVTLDNTQNTEYLLSNWNGSSGRLRIYTITGTPAAPVFTMTMLLPAATSTWAAVPNSTGADFAPQSTVTQRIQNNDARMQNCTYQNASIWCAHSVFLPTAAPTHTAAQWWQIDPTTATVQQFGRVEDTSGANFYAFPSIAVNAYNDVLLGYSSFSGSQFASSNYSFRLHTDPLNTLQPTVQFRAGLAKYFKIYSGTRNRWGDYSSTSVDPDNFSLWTLQEYADTPGGGLDRWATEWTHVVPPVSNLFSRDRTEDNGAEPDPSTLPMWESGDIWLRKNQDSTHAFAHMSEDAEFRTGTTNPNYVYVEVHNRGSVPSAGTEQLTLYWAKAGAGLSWPDPWNGGIYFDPGPNTMLMGNSIGTVPIPVTSAGGSSILELPWNPPDPGLYAVAFGGEEHHFCLLARITTSATAPYGMTFPETTDLYANVQQNNHVVWKNIQIFDILPGTGAPAYVVVLQNLGQAPMRTKVRFSALDTNGDPHVFEHGTLKITPVGRFKEIFRRTRVSGEGIRDLGDGTLSVSREDAVLEGITLAPKEWGALQLTFVPNDPAAKPADHVLRVTQLAIEATGDRVVGGQTFVFGKVKGFQAAAGDGPGAGRQAGKMWPKWWWLLLLLLLIVIFAIFLMRRR